MHSQKERCSVSWLELGVRLSGTAYAKPQVQVQALKKNLAKLQPKRKINKPEGTWINDPTCIQKRQGWIWNQRSMESRRMCNICPVITYEVEITGWLEGTTETATKNFSDNKSWHTRKIQIWTSHKHIMKKLFHWIFLFKKSQKNYNLGKFSTLGDCWIFAKNHESKRQQRDVFCELEESHHWSIILHDARWLLTTTLIKLLSSLLMARPRAGSHLRKVSLCLSSGTVFKDKTIATFMFWSGP